MAKKTSIFSLAVVLVIGAVLGTAVAAQESKVAIEPAASAWTITSSNYRIVGKLHSKSNLRDWLRGTTIAVQGSKL